MPRAALPSSRKALLFLLLAVAIVSSVAWCDQRQVPRDPVHDGQRLSEVVFDPQFLKMRDRAGIDRTLRSFGPAAIPWLAFQVEHGRRPSPRGSPSSHLPFENAPTWLRRGVPARLGGLRGSSTLDERINAALALDICAQEAAPAIPALRRNLDDEDRDLSQESAFILQKIGAASWPVVDDVLKHGKTAARSALLETMWARLIFEPTPDSEVENIVAALIDAADDPESAVRAGAAKGIGACCHRRFYVPLFRTAIPTLIRLTFDPNTEVRIRAVLGLSKCRDAGALAIPRLIELLDDPEIDIPAAYALEQVDRKERRSVARLRIMQEHSNHERRSVATRVLKSFELPPDE